MTLAPNLGNSWKLVNENCSEHLIFPGAVRRPCDVKVAAAALGWSIGLCQCESFEKLL